MSLIKRLLIVSKSSWIGHALLISLSLDKRSWQLEQQEIIESTALKRQGDRQDIASTCAFLINDANYITGQIINVDGGRSLSR